MILSPLILKGYFVTNISVKANVPNFSTPEEAAKAIAEGATDITSNVEAARNPNNRDWRIALRLRCRPADGKFCLYIIDIELVGFFEAHPDYDESKVEELVLCNGPSLLLGAARELILLVTSRGPMGPFTIPSASFIDIRPANGNEEQSHARKKTANVA